MSEKRNTFETRARAAEKNLKQWRGFLAKEPDVAEKAIRRVLGLLRSKGRVNEYDEARFYAEMKNGVSCPSDFGVREDGLMHVA